METKTAAVRMHNIRKTFGSTVANDKVNLDIYRGEILALLGENGSGKTTLMNMLSGIYFPDEGQIEVDGKTVTIGSPKDAFDLGIGMIHQHFKLVDVLTAAENIILGLPGKQRLDMKAVNARVREICAKYGFEVDPDQKIYNMSVSQKQTVEIVKVLYRGADILILDEHTAALDPKTAEIIMQLTDQIVKEKSLTTLMVTHNLRYAVEYGNRILMMHEGNIILDKREEQKAILETEEIMNIFNKISVECGN